MVLPTNDCWEKGEKEMLRVPKSSNRVVSSANDRPTANSKGSVELVLRTNPETTSPVLQFVEKGNYGRVRWSTTVQLSRAEVETMVRSAQDWLDAKVETTLEDQPLPVPERDEEVTEEQKDTFELVNGNR